MTTGNNLNKFQPVIPTKTQPCMQAMKPQATRGVSGLGGPKIYLIRALWEPPLFYESLGRASILEIAFSKPMVEQ